MYAIAAIYTIVITYAIFHTLVYMCRDFVSLRQIKISPRWSLERFVPTVLVVFLLYYQGGRAHELIFDFTTASLMGALAATVAFLSVWIWWPTLTKENWIRRLNITKACQAMAMTFLGVTNSWNIHWGFTIIVVIVLLLTFNDYRHEQEKLLWKQRNYQRINSTTS